MRKTLLFSFIAIFAISASIIIFSSCQKEEQIVQKEQIVNQEDNSSTLKAAVSSCSFPWNGTELSGSNNKAELQPGKYYKRIKRGVYLWNSYKWTVSKIDGNGIVIIRSVLYDAPSTWQILDYCNEVVYTPITLGPHTFTSQWDYIYYEIIVQNYATTVSWHLTY